VVRLVLDALPDDWQTVLMELDGLHPRDDTFPGEILLELALDALDLCGASRAAPIDYEILRQRHLPEISFAGKIAQQKSRYVVHAVAARRGGLQPDLLDGARWRSDCLVWAYYALVIYVRAAADRT
jgi:hypothetical protein